MPACRLEYLVNYTQLVLGKSQSVCKNSREKGVSKSCFLLQLQRHSRKSIATKSKTSRRMI